MTYYWPGSGIAKSQQNAFTAHTDGQPSIFASEPNKPGPKTAAQVLAKRYSGTYSAAHRTNPGEGA